MKDFLTLVTKILTEHAVTRDDDFKLYVWVCYELCPENMDGKFSKTMWNHEELGLPSYETVTRARRKAQEMNPALRGTKYKKRQERQEDYIETFSRR